LRGEIDARDPDAVPGATDLVEAAVKIRYGEASFEASGQALFVSAE
jgi:hypothetical protein